MPSEILWVTTKEMAGALRMHVNSLSRLKQAGFFTENRHYRLLNPTSQRSHLRWHLERTLVRMKAV